MNTEKGGPGPPFCNAQHEGWYDYQPFPGDLAKLMAMPKVFKVVWSDHRIVIFSIDPHFTAKKEGD
jgi:hypothetical protein